MVKKGKVYNLLLIKNNFENKILIECLLFIRYYVNIIKYF